MALAGVVFSACHFPTRYPFGCDASPTTTSPSSTPLSESRNQYWRTNGSYDKFLGVYCRASTSCLPVEIVFLWRCTPDQRNGCDSDTRRSVVAHQQPGRLMQTSRLRLRPRQILTHDQSASSKPPNILPRCPIAELWKNGIYPPRGTDANATHSDTHCGSRKSWTMKCMY